MSAAGASQLPGVAVSFRRGLVLVFGQPRKLLAVSVLLLVLILPVLGTVSAGTAVYLATFVVITLMSVTYLRREDATVRVSFTWLAVVAASCALFTVTWIGLLLVALFVPFVAISVAAWASGSWRIGARAVRDMFRSTWVATIACCLAVDAAFVLGGVGAAWFARGTGAPVGVAFLLIIAVIVFEMALSIGYALVALERRAALVLTAAST